MTLEAVLDIAMTGDPWAPAAGDWVTIGRVTGVHTKSGRQAQLGRMEPGDLTLEVSDPTRQLDPHNPASVYAGKIDEQRPIRVRARDTAAGYGPVPVWQGWLTPQGVEPVTDGYNDHRAQLRATDALGAVATAPMPSSALGLYLAAPNMTLAAAPVAPRGGKVQAWFPAQEPTLAAGASPIDAGPNAWGGSSFQAAAGGGPLDGSADGLSWSIGTGQYVLLAQGATVQVPFTIGFWVVVVPRAGTAYRTVLAQYDSSSRLGLRVRIQDASAYCPNEVVVDLAGPSGTMSYFRADFTTSGSVAKVVADGRPHFVTVSYYTTGSNPATDSGIFVLEVDGAQSIYDSARAARPAIYAPPPASGVAAGYMLVGADNGGGTTFGGSTVSWLQGNVAHLVMMNGATTESPTTLYNAAGRGVLWESSGLYFYGAPFAHYTDDRARNVLAGLGWPAALTDVPARGAAELGNVAMTGLQYSGQSALDLLAMAALAEDGEVRATKDGKVKFRGGLGRPAAVTATWDDGTSGVAGALPYADVALERSTVVNRQVVTRDGTAPVFIAAPPSIAEDAASIARFRRREATTALPIIDLTTRQNRAAALLARTKLPASRIRTMRVDLASSAAVRDAVLGAELEDLWRVLYKPPGAGYQLDVQVRLVGIAHTHERGRWIADLTLAPY